LIIERGIETERDSNGETMIERGIDIERERERVK